MVGIASTMQIPLEMTKKTRQASFAATKRLTGLVFSFCIIDIIAYID